MKLKEDKNLRKRDSERENKWLSIKMKNRTANKKWTKRPQTRLKRAQKLWQKGGKKEGKLGHARAVQNGEKGAVKQ